MLTAAISVAELPETASQVPEVSAVGFVTGSLAHFLGQAVRSALCQESYQHSIPGGSRTVFRP